MFPIIKIVAIPQQQGVPYNEEIIVESSLQVRKKDQNRQKRQFGGFGPYG